MTNDFNSKNYQELVKRFGIECKYQYFPYFEAVFKATQSGSIDK